MQTTNKTLTTDNSKRKIQILSTKDYNILIFNQGRIEGFDVN